MSIDNHVKYKTDVKIKKYFRTSFFQLNVIPVDGMEPDDFSNKIKFAE